MADTLALLSKFFKVIPDLLLLGDCEFYSKGVKTPRALFTLEIFGEEINLFD